MGKYRGYEMSYENGQFIGKLGSVLFQEKTEMILKSAIDNRLYQPNSKCIDMGKYNGFYIAYHKELFMATKKKHGETKFINKTETELKASIDNYLKQQAEEKKLIESKQYLAKPVKITVDAQAFKDCVRSVVDYISEASLRFEKGKQVMTLLEMDPANVAMVKRVLPFKGKADTFKAFINISNLWILLRTIIPKKSALNGSDVPKEITLTFVMNEKRRLFVNNGFGEFDININEPDDREQKEPNLSPEAKVLMSKHEFAHYIDMADIVAEAVAFDVISTAPPVKHSFCMYAFGDLTNYKKEGIAKAYVKEAKSYRSKYSLEYLKKCNMPGNNLTIQFHKDYPLMITDELGNVFILAPRVEND